MKKILFILLLLPLIQVFGLEINLITPYVFLDVRSITETKADKLKSETYPSIILPYDDSFQEKIGTISKYKNHCILIYCRTGRRAEIAKGLLEKAGFKYIHNLKTLENAKDFEKKLSKALASQTKIQNNKTPDNKATVNTKK